MNKPNPNLKYVVQAMLYILPYRRKRAWGLIIMSLIISIFLELTTREFGITGETTPALAALNGGLIWLALSLLFQAAEPISYRVFYRLMGMDVMQSFRASQVLDSLIVIFSGQVMVGILHLTGTATPAPWGWYFIIGMLYCVLAAQLRKKKLAVL